VDILKQSYAVQRAIQKFESTLLQGHLTHCVPNGLREGREDAVVGELVELFELSQR
jgi:DNA-binding FrmR family transcriptional regulator